MFDEAVSVEVVRRFCHIASHRLGVSISASHEALVAGRVAKRLQLLQVAVDEYMSRLDEDQECSEVVGFLDFLRPRPPRFFARIDDHTALHRCLVHWFRAGRRRIRLWSAGCGTGEEAYGMALTAMSAVQASEVGLDNVDIKILATDISPPMLERGKRGVFDDEQMRDVPPYIRDRYFHESDGGIVIDEDIKDMVYFRRLNPTTMPYPMSGPLEAIFCHEALQPLLASARTRAARAIAELIAHDGLLCTGFRDDELVEQDPSVAPVRQIPIRRGHC